MFLGGCDGCLNWEGVGKEWEEAEFAYRNPDVGKTDNNGLGPTVVVLEQIYTDPEFPKVFICMIESLERSMRMHILTGTCSSVECVSENVWKVKS